MCHLQKYKLTDTIEPSRGTTDRPKAGKENNMYRVWRVLRDEHGNIVHKAPVGCARTERGARALIAGQWGECIIEKLQ